MSFDMCVGLFLGNKKSIVNFLALNVSYYIIKEIGRPFWPIYV